MSATEPLVERARTSRSSGAVLKVRVSNLRSRDREALVFIFEGPTDIGPYDVWIKQLRAGLKYVALAADGKSQVLDFRRRLVHDTGGLRKGVFMFVDRDFDDLRGQARGDDIFCTDAYSIENYLASGSAVQSILTDEFQCTGENGDSEAAVKLYEDVLGQFLAQVREANRRLYRARVLGIPGKGAEDRVTKYVTIGLKTVEGVKGADLKTLIPLEREPEAGECTAIDEVFDSLDPPLRYRGKFVLGFVLSWLDLLVAERKSGGSSIFSTTLNMKYSSATLTHRSLATRVAGPEGLGAFLNKIDAAA